MKKPSQNSNEDSLELALRERIKPMLNEKTGKLIGVSIEKLTDDISSKLDKFNMFELHIDYNISYSPAKKKFRKAYLTRLLMLNLGNISEAAKTAGLDRRSLHRMITSLGIEVNKIKKDLVKPYSIRVDAMNHLIENVLNNYKSIIHPDKLKNVYMNVNSISENIVDQLPEMPLSMKDAEEEFEKSFFSHALKNSGGNISQAARQTGIRYETLHRKIKSLGIR